MDCRPKGPQDQTTAGPEAHRTRAAAKPKKREKTLDRARPRQKIRTPFAWVTERLQNKRHLREVIDVLLTPLPLPVLQELVPSHWQKSDSPKPPEADETVTAQKPLEADETVTAQKPLEADETVTAQNPQKRTRP